MKRIDLSLHIHNDFNVQQLFNIVTQSRTGSETVYRFLILIKSNRRTSRLELRLTLDRFPFPRKTWISGKELSILRQNRPWRFWLNFTYSRYPTRWTVTFIVRFLSSLSIRESSFGTSSKLELLLTRSIKKNAQRTFIFWIFKSNFQILTLKIGIQIKYKIHKTNN